MVLGWAAFRLDLSWKRGPRRGTGLHPAASQPARGPFCEVRGPPAVILQSMCRVHGRVPPVGNVGSGDHADTIVTRLNEHRAAPPLYRLHSLLLSDQIIHAWPLRCNLYLVCSCMLRYQLV